MIGGLVEAITWDDGCWRIIVCGTKTEHREIRAIRLVDCEAARAVLPGDTIWWQNGWALWSPTEAERAIPGPQDCTLVPPRGQQRDDGRICDIPIARKGYAWDPANWKEKT